MKGLRSVYWVAQPDSHSSWVKRLLVRVARWHQLSRERASLRKISDAALKDLGLSRADIEIESHRAFWDDPFSK